MRTTAQNYSLAREVHNQFQETSSLWSLMSQSVELVTQNPLEVVWQGPKSWGAVVGYWWIAVGCCSKHKEMRKRN